MPGKPNPTGSATLAADSLARGKNQTPQQRIANHNEKRRKSAMRQTGTPGPGAYTPARPAAVHGGASSSGKSSSSTAGTAAFASKSKRGFNNTKYDDVNGDPGAYDPDVLKNLAVTSKKSASKNYRAGSGSFGTLQQRKIAIDIMGEATPGPGAYNGDSMMRSGKKAALAAMDTGERMPSSSFKSKSAKTYKYPNEGVPGAGAYTPQWTAIEKAPRNPANGLKAKGNRFSGADSWERAQATEPGPGAYEVEYLRSGAKSSLASQALDKAASSGMGRDIAFGTDDVRTLPWENL